MELKPNELIQKATNFVAKTREKMWQRIEHDTQAQAIRDEWVGGLTRIASALDAPGAARIKLALVTKADDIGKQVAVSSNVLNIVTGVASGVAGVGVGVDSMRLSPGEQMIASRQVLKTSLDTNKMHWEKRKKPLIASAALLGTSLGVLRYKPVMREAYFIGKLGLPLAEKVAKTVNTILWKQEHKRAAKQMLVGMGKPQS